MHGRAVGLQPADGGGRAALAAAAPRRRRPCPRRPSRPRRRGRTPAPRRRATGRAPPASRTDAENEENTEFPFGQDPLTRGGTVPASRIRSPVSYARHPRDAAHPSSPVIPSDNRSDSESLSPRPVQPRLSTNPPVSPDRFADTPHSGQAAVPDVTSQPPAHRAVSVRARPSAGGVSQSDARASDAGSALHRPAVRRKADVPRAGRGRPPPRRCPPTSSSARPAPPRAPSAALHDDAVHPRRPTRPDSWRAPAWPTPCRSWCARPSSVLSRRSQRRGVTASRNRADAPVADSRYSGCVATLPTAAPSSRSSRTPPSGRCRTRRPSRTAAPTATLAIAVRP